MNRAFMPGIVPDERYPSLRRLLSSDKIYITSQMLLGHMEEDLGNLIIAYIDKYSQYV